MRSAFVRFVLAFIALATISEARAEDAKAVKIDVQVISATTGEGGVDKRLERLRDQLGDFKYSAYQLVSEQTVSVAVDNSQNIELPEKYVLRITPKNVEANGKIKVQIHVRSEKTPNLLDTEYTIAPGKPMVVGVGNRQKDRALLIALTHRAER